VAYKKTKNNPKKQAAPKDDDNEEPEIQKRRKDGSKSEFWVYIVSVNIMLTIAATDEDGMYLDVNIFDIGDEANTKKKVDPTADIKHFFGEPFSLEGHGKRKRRICNICQYVFNCSRSFYWLIKSRKKQPGSTQTGLGDNCTSLRRHMQAFHWVRFKIQMTL